MQPLTIPSFPLSLVRVKVLTKLALYLSAMFEDLEFRYPFRKYQRMILAKVDSEREGGQGDDKYHIAAPPGSGKTIVGLELTRKFGHPTVVFAPTTTIQQQWQQKVGMFLAEGAQIERHASLTPDRLAPINIYTYQLISTAGESRERVNEMALKLWVEDLLEEGQVEQEAETKDRIEVLKKNNPTAYRKELARRYLRVKRKLLREDPAVIEQFLHPNALALIEALVAHGVRTVVLDECHHLLDYWAIVLRYLLSRIEGVQVIGLTATLPSPDGDDEFENYDSLLGEVDFEVPTPAVVKEGDLAPYRDLVYFVEPTQRETKFLKNIQEAFEQAVAELVESNDFNDWVWDQLPERPSKPAQEARVEEAGTGKTINEAGRLEENTENEEIEANAKVSSTEVNHPIQETELVKEDEMVEASDAWQAFLNKQPLFSTALIKYLHQKKVELPPEWLVPEEATQKMNLEDWSYLLERYGLKHLRVSKDKGQHQQFRKLKRILRDFGLTLTEKGMRQSRTPGDLVLSFSEAKDRAAGNLLAQEAGVMGQSLRAVVVTDFEKMSSGVQKLEGVLDRDAGSARRVFRHLVQHPGAGQLDPLLVTGKTVMVDADVSEPLLDFFNEYLEKEGLKASCRYKDTDQEGILELVGEGKDWSSRTYVRTVTEAFEQGLTRCLVGTRGIFGEGWDALSLNTLVDLTSVTTSTSVQQLRGRTIRIDPAWERKLAHNWDIICVSKKFERGDLDLVRFIKRHNHYWGLMGRTSLEEKLDEATEKLLDAAWGGIAHVGPENHIVKGVMHVDPNLARDLAYRNFKRVNFDKYTRRMLAQISTRDRSYELWDIGAEYENFTYRATDLEVEDLRIISVFTLDESLRKLMAQFKATLAYLLFWSIMGLIYVEIIHYDFGILGALAALVVWFSGLGYVFRYEYRLACKLWEKMVVGQPPDFILRDMGRALLATLKELGLVSPHLQQDFVRVAKEMDGSYRLLLDYASPEDGELFVKSFGELFEPLRNPRYLILQKEVPLPSRARRSLWYMLRRFAQKRGASQPAYYPLPKILGARRSRADCFGRYWNRYVGGDELVYTRTDMGRKILLEAKAQRRPKVKQMAFEVWR